MLVADANGDPQDLDQDPPDFEQQIGEGNLRRRSDGNRPNRSPPKSVLRRYSRWVENPASAVYQVVGDGGHPGRDPSRHPSRQGLHRLAASAPRMDSHRVEITARSEIWLTHPGRPQMPVVSVRSVRRGLLLVSGPKPSRARCGPKVDWRLRDARMVAVPGNAELRADYKADFQDRENIGAFGGGQRRAGPPRRAFGVDGDVPRFHECRAAHRRE